MQSHISKCWSRDMRIANSYENCKLIWKLQTHMKIANVHVGTIHRNVRIANWYYLYLGTGATSEKWSEITLVSPGHLEKEKKSSFFLRAQALCGDQVKSPLSLRTHSLLQYGSPGAPLYWPYLGPRMESEDNCSIHLIVDRLALLLFIWDWRCNEHVRS